MNVFFVILYLNEKENKSSCREKYMGFLMKETGPGFMILLDLSLINKVTHRTKSIDMNNDL
jgi:hypothetical protein